MPQPVKRQDWPIGYGWHAMKAPGHPAVPVAVIEHLNSERALVPLPAFPQRPIRTSDVAFNGCKWFGIFDTKEQAQAYADLVNEGIVGK